MNITSSPVEELVDLCSQATEQFLTGLEADTRFCFELMRRAFQDRDEAAFTHVYRIYQAQMERWVRRNWRYEALEASLLDVIVSEAFFSCYRAICGPRFGEFATVSSVLGYLRLCIGTTLATYLRQRRHEASEVELEDETSYGVASDLDRALTSAQIWQRVAEVLTNRLDYQLVDHRFRQGMVPAEISRRRPDLWPTPRDVTVALQRVCRGLAKDEALRELLRLGIWDEVG